MTPAEYVTELETRVRTLTEALRSLDATQPPVVIKPDPDLPLLVEFTRAYRHMWASMIDVEMMICPEIFE